MRLYAKCDGCGAYAPLPEGGPDGFGFLGSCTIPDGWSRLLVVSGARRNEAVPVRVEHLACGACTDALIAGVRERLASLHPVTAPIA